MISRIVQGYKALRALQTLRSLGIDELADTYLNSGSSISSFSAEAKKRIREDLYSEIASILHTENGFMVLREKLAALAYSYASLQVLSLKENEKNSPPKDGPYISGKLHHRITELVDFNDDLKKIVQNAGIDSADEIISICNARYVMKLLHLNSVNILRTVSKDIAEDRDWFRPFVKSMLIYQEDQ